jgi:hypothetical protein
MSELSNEMRIKLPEGVKLKRRTWGHEVWLNDVVIGGISRDEEWDVGDDNDKHIRYWFGMAHFRWYLGGTP